jgi:CheY-like chemotaxis protein
LRKSLTLSIVTSSQSGGGSGLGLLISKGLVEQHGGTIAIDSAGPGLGATATIELPLYQFPEAERAKPIKPSDVRGDAEVLSDSTEIKSTRRVLVVDDALPNRKMLVRLLERAGHTCMSACNGEEAVRMFKEDRDATEADFRHAPIDTILMDYEMPVLNGPDATKRLREMGCTALVIGVTGNVLAEDVAYFKSMGATAVLAKPVQVSLLDDYWRQYRVPQRYPKTNFLEF